MLILSLSQNSNVCNFSFFILFFPISLIFFFINTFLLFIYFSSFFLLHTHVALYLHFYFWFFFSTIVHSRTYEYQKLSLSLSLSHSYTHRDHWWMFTHACPLPHHRLSSSLLRLRLVRFALNFFFF